MKCEHPRLSLSSIDIILEIVKSGGVHKNCLKLSNLIQSCLHLGIQELSSLNSLAVWGKEEMMQAEAEEEARLK